MTFKSKPKQAVLLSPVYLAWQLDTDEVANN